MISLAIRDELDLPDSAVTNSFALLAMKGAGKSNAAVVFAEQLFALGIPWVCVDPKGDWWGIRSGAGGKKGGLSVPIFGGLHADVPIDPGAGALFADLIVDQHMTALIDVSELTKGESIRFLTAFFDRLYRKKNRATYPMHLFLEECDDYVPQKVYRELAALVRTVELVVKRGRQRGLGITLASQRAASVNKDVLTQTDTLIVLRNTSPQDRKAILGWIDYNAGARDIVDELPTLHDGEAWVSSPAQLRILAKVKFRRRSTFDSGSTPELGEKVKAATLADIDVEAITASVGDLVERAKADDPKKLRARIAELERTKWSEAVEPIVKETIREVEVPIVPPGVIEALEATLAEYDAAIERMKAVRAALVDAQKKTRAAIAAKPAARNTARPKPAAPAPSPIPPHGSGAADSTRLESPELRLGKRERAILSVLAQYPQGRSEKQLALLTGYSAKASTIGAGLSALRKAGYVEGRQITAAGREALGDFDPLPVGPDLLEYWRGELGKRERSILDALLERYPESMTHDEVCAVTGYSPDASTVGAGMSKLRGLELVDGWTLSADFAAAIA